MNCPYCNTFNDPSNQFCEKCGKPLHEISPQAGLPDLAIARDRLLAYTFRLVICLFGLWIVNTVLVGLNFVKDLRIPEIPIPATTLITLIVMLFVFFLLLIYARVLAKYWPLAFPRMREASYIWTALMAIVLLDIGYRILKPILLQISPETEPLMILQLGCILVAIVVVFRAVVIVYQAVPSWYIRIKEDWAKVDKSLT